MQVNVLEIKTCVPLWRIFIVDTIYVIITVVCQLLTGSSYPRRRF